jgi:hypothetical protein
MLMRWRFLSGIFEKKLLAALCAPIFIIAFAEGLPG